MTWMSFVAQRRVKIAHRLTIWSAEAHRRGKIERANKLARLAAQQMERAYKLELTHRSAVA